MDFVFGDVSENPLTKPWLPRFSLPNAKFSSIDFDIWVCDPFWAQYYERCQVCRSFGLHVVVQLLSTYLFLLNCRFSLSKVIVFVWICFIWFVHLLFCQDNHTVFSRVRCPEPFVSHGQLQNEFVDTHKTACCSSD